MNIDDETVLSDDDALAAVLDGSGVPRLTVGLLGRVRWLAQVASERGEALTRRAQEADSARAKVTSLESQLTATREQRAAVDRALILTEQPMDELMPDQGVIRLYHELMAVRGQLDVVYDDLRREREASQRSAAEAAAHDLKVAQERTAAPQCLAELEGANSRLKQLIEAALQRSTALEGKIEGALRRCAELEDKIAALERVS